MDLTEGECWLYVNIVESDIALRWRLADERDVA